MTQRGQWIFVLGIVGALVGGLIGGVALSGALKPVGIDTEAPDFTAVDVFAGDTVRFERYAGDVVLLNVWATWCTPCEAEMPSMQRLHEQLGDSGFHIVAVSIDGGSTRMVREWVEERGFTFEVLHDRSGRIERFYQTTGVPESFVIDRHGIIVKKVIGATEWDDPTQQALIRRLIEGDGDARHSD
ncbi:MAG: TlpA disulfide reductase family protein [Gemmatimonadales bacterium]|jgi:peroxiredoxin